MSSRTALELGEVVTGESREADDVPQLIVQRRVDERRVVARDRQVHAGAPEGGHWVRLERCVQADPDVRRRTEVEDDLVAYKSSEECGIANGRDAVIDPIGLEDVE